jgi:hypothetical protein
MYLEYDYIPILHAKDVPIDCGPNNQLTIGGYRLTEGVALRVGFY